VLLKIKRTGRAMYLGDNLELLALAERGLGDGLLDTSDALLVEVLELLSASQEQS
jgi:hypothetical protein